MDYKYYASVFPGMCHVFTDEEKVKHESKFNVKLQEINLIKNNTRKEENNVRHHKSSKGLI